MNTPKKGQLYSPRRLLLIITTCLSLALQVINTDTQKAQPPKPKYSKLILKTCEGCALAHYANVVKFIKYDLERYGGKIETNYKCKYSR